jgi:O-antigen/teichoic acid export membrane protein
MKGLGLRQLIAHVGTTLFQQMATLLCHIVLIAFLAHVLGPEEFGRYAVAALLPTVLSTVLNLGIPAANVYFLGRGDASVRAILRWNLRIGAVLAASGALFSSALVLGPSPAVFPGVPARLLWLGTAVFPIALFFVLMTSLLRGRQEFKQYNVAMVAYPAINLAAALLLVGAGGLGAVGAIAAFGIGQAAGLLAAIWFIRASSRRDSGSNTTSGSIGWQNLSYGLKAHLSNILSFLNYRIDIFFVNFFLGPGGAGIYTAAVRVAEQLWVVANATVVVLMPRLSELHREEDIRRRLTPLIARWVTLSSVAMAILLGATIGWIVDLVFGPGYEQTAVVLLWLLPGIVIYNCTRILAHDISARGRPDLNVWPAAAAVVFNMVANILLIPRLGVIGAALATTLAYTIATTACFVLYTRLSGNRFGEVVWLNRTDWDLAKRALAMARRGDLRAR